MTFLCFAWPLLYSVNQGKVPSGKSYFGALRNSCRHLDNSESVGYFTNLAEETSDYEKLMKTLAAK